MANSVIVVGGPGTGKTTASRSLPSQETYIVNTLNKRLPWKNSGKQYNKDLKNIIALDDYQTIVNLLKHINTNKSEIKYLILDDIGFVMQNEFFERASESGYTKFAEIGRHMQSIIKTVTELRDDLNVALLFHEDIINGVKKLKTIGQMLDDKYDPLATVSVALFTDVKFNDQTQKAEYRFITNRTNEHPAKSPEGMFDLYVPNDFKLVFDQMNEYYGKN